jgi:hypothetical protein
MTTVDCTECKFLTNTQNIPNHPTLDSISVCALFNIQIIDSSTQGCTGYMPLEPHDADPYANTNSFDEQYSN